jgi:hypothetical protein
MDEQNILKLKNNILKLKNNIIKKNLYYTTFSDSIYNNLWYVDSKNKICITFTPRGGCSISFQQYLDLVDLLKDGLNYSNFIQKYRNDLFEKCINYIEINELIKENYIFIKFIMNPYIRAVSIYRVQKSHDLSFREYLKQLVDNKIDYFNPNDKYHLHPQYIDGEEKIITKYIKINENEKYNIVLCNEQIYEIDVNKYTSLHHGIKTDYNEFCGDLPLNEVNDKLPKNYKYFYDDEIKKLVETYYKDDIEKYGFSFDNF